MCLRGNRQHRQLRDFDVAWLLQSKQHCARDVIGVEALLETVVKVLCLLGIAEALLDESAAYQSRYDLGNTNSAAGKIEAQGFAEPMHGEFTTWIREFRADAGCKMLVSQWN
jgi:hypothetical protein